VENILRKREILSKCCIYLDCLLNNFKLSDISRSILTAIFKVDLS